MSGGSEIREVKIRDGAPGTRLIFLALGGLCFGIAFGPAVGAGVFFIAGALTP